MISEKQFNTLVYLLNNLNVENIYKEKTLLEKLKVFNSKCVTNIDFIRENIETILDKYKVKRAIIFAAGFGSRMMPLTAQMPKPLIKVFNKSFIETEIEALIKNDIKDIYIVTGYCSNAFNNFERKYSDTNIHFITNYFYDKGNNIISAYLIRNLLDNSYVLDGDLYIQNDSIFSQKYFYYSNYVTIYKENTNDWVLYKDKDNKFISHSGIGGKNIEQMIGISFYTKDDGLQLAKYIETTVEKNMLNNAYFDEVSTKFYAKKFKITTRKYTEKDVIEIDSYDELINLRNKYEQN